MKTRQTIRAWLAFTLLEVMVAMALLTLIVAAIYSSWNAILKGTRVALDVAAEAQRARITMRALHDSLVCACMYNQGGTNNYYIFDAEADSKMSSMSFVARLPRSFPRSGKFGDFTTRRLEFTIEAGKDQKRNLVLRQRPILMKFDPDEIQFPLVLARDVQTFLVEYVDPQSGDWVTEWGTSNTLPKEVRITMGLAKVDRYSTEAQEQVVDIISIPSVPVPVAYQSAGGAPTGSPNGNPNQNNLGNANGGAGNNRQQVKPF